MIWFSLSQLSVRRVSGELVKGKRLRRLLKRRIGREIGGTGPERTSYSGQTKMEKRDHEIHGQ